MSYGRVIAEVLNDGSIPGLEKAEAAAGQPFKLPPAWEAEIRQIIREEILRREAMHSAGLTIDQNREYRKSAGLSDAS